MQGGNATIGIIAVLVFVGLADAQEQAKNQRPNILWITSEDNGPQLGCYGDTFATTPHIDALASRGTRYLNAWSNAPVCAPARTTIISGMYPTCLGAEHMRSLTRLPTSFKMYPQYLREAGYYCTNNSKEDYNLEKPGKVWDESSGKAHWKNRGAGQPFFAIFNITTSHESQIRTRPHKWVHDPGKVRVPPYHPDTLEVRQDWAQYHDKITEMDVQVGKRLAELERAGLSEDTIVFYYGDHGSGMPRSKRWPYNSGLRVPLVIHIPEKFRDLASPDYQVGATSDRLVSFVDLAPTLMSLAGVTIPTHFQGRAFLGSAQAPANDYLFGFRGRMDERLDLVRTIRDNRYIYIRNFMPHKIYGQYVSYMFETPTTRVWKNLFDEGKLNEVQSRFWRAKPAEELYDLQEDPDEVNNLANDPAHTSIKEKLHKELFAKLEEIRDIGFLPEDEIHRRSAGSTPYETGHSESYNSHLVIETANLASSMDPNAMPKLLDGLANKESAVRYWSVVGLLIGPVNDISAFEKRLINLLDDPAPSVRIAAAELLGARGAASSLTRSLDMLIAEADVTQKGLYVSLQALNAIDSLGEKASPLRERLASLPRADRQIPSRLGSYVDRLLARLLNE